MAQKNREFSRFKMLVKIKCVHVSSFGSTLSNALSFWLTLLE